MTVESSISDPTAQPALQRAAKAPATSDSASLLQPADQPADPAAQPIPDTVAERAEPASAQLSGGDFPLPAEIRAEGPRARPTQTAEAPDSCAGPAAKLS